MPSCILHVGMHKTGTSSIQTTLGGLSERAGPALAWVDEPNMSRIIKLAFKADKPGEAGRGPAAELAAGGRKRARDAFRDLLDSVRVRDIIISAEVMVHLTAAELRDLLGCIPHAQISAIGYARPPVSYMSSACQERIKAGMSTLNVSSFFPNYEALFGKFQEFMPLEMIKYERADLKNGCVVQDFAERVGVAVGADEVVNVNESLSRLAVQLLFCLNVWRARNGLTSLRGTTLVPLLQTIRDVPFRLADTLTVPVVERNRRAVAWVEGRLGSPFRPGPPPTDVIASIEQLMTPGPAASLWLSRRLGYRRTEAMTPEEIGLNMQTLYERSLFRAAKA